MVLGSREFGTVRGLEKLATHPYRQIRSHVTFTPNLWFEANQSDLCESDWNQKIRITMMNHDGSHLTLEVFVESLERVRLSAGPQGLRLHL